MSEEECQHEEITVTVQLQQERFYYWKDDEYTMDSEFSGAFEIIKPAECLECGAIWSNYDSFLRYMEDKENGQTD